MTQELNAKIFSEQVGTSFSVSQGSAEPITLELYEVTESSTSPALEQFALFFRGPVSPVMPQSTMRLEHATLGALDLFLVPIGPDDKGMRYQAVFSRFRK